MAGNGREAAQALGRAAQVDDAGHAKEASWPMPAGVRLAR